MTTIKNTRKNFLSNTTMAAAILLTSSLGVQAQNASEYNNNAPINGVSSTALGWLALFNSGTADSNNTAVGYNALFSSNSGYHNTALGSRALYNNTNGSYNSAFGTGALFSNTSGISNLAFGADALFSNTTGYDNTSIGNQSMYANTTGFANVAIGGNALSSNTTGQSNTAIGSSALANNISGGGNTAFGDAALFANTNGVFNLAFGTACLGSNTSGSRNTANGTGSLFNNSTGNYNSAFGDHTLDNNSTGSYNVAIGNDALTSNTTGNYNTALGQQANVSSGNLTNATAIGKTALVNASNKIRFGNAAVTVVEGPVAYTISDGRFKTNIKQDDVKGLEFIKKLRPVVYNFDSRKFTEFLTKNMSEEQRKAHLEDDFTAAKAIRQSGFIAQEVEKAAQETGYDFNGVHKPVDENDNYSLAYGQFVVPLVKGMQEQQQMIEQLQQTVKNQQTLINSLLDKGAGTGITINSSSLDGFSMSQNEPNPFTRETIIKYNLPAQINNAYMAVYDLTGKQIASYTLSQKGEGVLTLNADKLAAGIYIYSIVADGKILDSKRMVVAEK